MAENSIQTTPINTPMPPHVAEKIKAGHTMIGDEKTQTSASRWICEKQTCRKFAATYPPVPTENPGGVWGSAIREVCPTPTPEG